MDIERFDLPRQPADLSPMDAALDYRFNGSKYARVILEMSEGPNDHFNIKAQAFELDVNGRYVMAPKGYPSRSRQTTHTVARSSLGDTATLAPGWVRVPPPAQGVIDATNVPEGTTFPEELPPTAAPGAHAYVGDRLYRWDDGIARGIAAAKVAELANVLANSDALSNLGFNRGAL